jgi:hypothetical protein
MERGRKTNAVLWIRWYAPRYCPRVFAARVDARLVPAASRPTNALQLLQIHQGSCAIKCALGQTFENPAIVGFGIAGARKIMAAETGDSSPTGSTTLAQAAKRSARWRQTNFSVPRAETPMQTRRPTCTSSSGKCLRRSMRDPSECGRKRGSSRTTFRSIWSSSTRRDTRITSRSAGKRCAFCACVGRAARKPPPHEYVCLPGRTRPQLSRFACCPQAIPQLQRPRRNPPQRQSVSPEESAKGKVPRNQRNGKLISASP